MLFLFPVTINFVWAVYMCTRPCTWPIHGGGHGLYTTLYMTVYTAMDTACLHGRVLHYVDGCVHGGVTAVYTAHKYTRPVYETYRICIFLTICCDYMRKQSKASYCMSPEVY